MPFSLPSVLALDPSPPERRVPTTKLLNPKPQLASDQVVPREIYDSQGQIRTVGQPHLTCIRNECSEMPGKKTPPCQGAGLHGLTGSVADRDPRGRAEI